MNVVAFYAITFFVTVRGGFLVTLTVGNSI